MSIRSLVTLCSLMLMAWLVAAFVHTPSAQQESNTAPTEEATAQAVQEDQEGLETDELTVSVSP